MGGIYREGSGPARLQLGALEAGDLKGAQTTPQLLPVAGKQTDWGSGKRAVPLNHLAHRYKNICMLKLFASLVIFRVNPVASPWNRMKPKRHVVRFPTWGSWCCVPGNEGLNMRSWGSWAGGPPDRTHIGGHSRSAEIFKRCRC